ncbi:MAG TPA: hypothetical protein VNS58_26490 [Puia sp.]|nr:hypothetical protein [Puia sp.]
MKRNKFLAVAALATIAVTLVGSTICLVKKHKRKKRLQAISDAGYELAYDIHYPTTYKKINRN